MSTTTTENPVTYSIVRTLADYELHHSGASASGPVAAPSSHPPPRRIGQDQNPADWLTEYRRVPPYRPVNTELDFASRNQTLNGIERAFIANMFGGIRIVELLNKTWRATGGKLNDTYFRFKVGGEY
ncbi:hypothetical protein K461DRAFT_320610 [Myriangium duriaei CBS 260.36]|uniref:Uncharacterized protein n=1 Tax=Myriangium duriaei CBS 260.36 TaxID=1168546 RepID=A0A9P4MML1_9PEZI|nr:hypothetical protein K461DRAFT_320610 [Myriangium duriaei CBS 260.36]